MSQSVENKISIIIPVYNVEKYLKRCLDSLLSKQSLREIELICIDDESSDNCPKILDEYAKNDFRVKVIYKKNEGQGVARNEGLKIATGEYVFFVDPDDWIEPNTLQICYDKIKAEDSDVLFFNAIKHYEKVNKIVKYDYIAPYKKFNGKPFHPLDAKDVLYKTSAHVFKIYKRKSLLKYNFQYAERKCWEDHLPYFCFLANCEKISTLNKNVYNYLIRNNSSTFTFSNMIEMFFVDFFECEQALLNTKYGKYVINGFLDYKLNNFFKYLKILPLNKKVCFYNKMKSVINYIAQNYGEDIINSNRYGYKLQMIKKYPIFLYIIKRIKLIIQTSI